MTVLVTTDAVFQQIAVRHNGDHARLLWQDDGRVILVSSYGNWSYFWSHRGDRSVPEFLVDLDIDYMGSKMLGCESQEFDDKGTSQAIRETILEYRREGSITKEQARSEWEEVECLEDGEYDFRQWYEASEHLGPDCYELRRTKTNSNWYWFWKRIWEPLIQPELKENCTLMGDVE